jgi:hypothetical protein
MTQWANFTHAESLGCSSLSRVIRASTDKVTFCYSAEGCYVAHDPASAFIEAACVPRDAHQSGTLEDAEMILTRYPFVATGGI